MLDWPIILLKSPSFWSGPASFGLAAIGTAFVGMLVIRWRFRSAGRPRNLLRDESGAAAAVDFILTLPIVLLVVLLAVQFALLANASLVVHYAAYSSARSARVHFFDTSSFWTRSLRASGTGNAASYWSFNRGNARAKAADAASMALIAISPAKRSINSNPRQSDAWSAMDRYISVTAGGSPQSGNAVFRRKAAFAFDPDNTRIDVELDIDPLTLVTGIFGSGQLTEFEEWPVRASVEYRYFLYLPVGWMLSDDSDGTNYFRWIPAEVVLL